MIADNYLKIGMCSYLVHDYLIYKKCDCRVDCLCPFLTK